MVEFKIKDIKCLEPKQKFQCYRCDREGMVSPKGVKRRFEITMKTPVGEEEKFCVVCASILTGKRQGELMKEGRAHKAK
jgi:hypothetical protein